MSRFALVAMVIVSVIFTGGAPHDPTMPDLVLLAGSSDGDGASGDGASGDGEADKKTAKKDSDQSTETPKPKDSDKPKDGEGKGEEKEPSVKPPEKADDQQKKPVEDTGKTPHGAPDAGPAPSNTSFSYYVTITAKKAGDGTGTISGNGINCGNTCTAKVPAGTAVTLTATPASGSTFGGWSGRCSGTGSCTFRPSSNATVTATFKKAPSATVTVAKSGDGAGAVSGNGINCGSTCTATVPSGTSFTLTAAPAADSTFGGWSGPCTGTGSCSFTASSNTTVTATFKKTPNVTVTVTKTGDGTGSVNGSGIDCGTTCTATVASGTSVSLTAAPANDSTFGGWSGPCTATVGPCTFTATANGTVTATFTKKPNVTLAVTKSGEGTGTVTGNGIDCGSTCTTTVPSGTHVTLTASPAPDSTFGGWSGPCADAGSRCDFWVSSDTTVTATFTKASTSNVTLTVAKAGEGTGTVTGNGIDCGSTCTATVPANTTVVLNAGAAPDSTFVGWSGPCTGTGWCAFTATADTTVTATFTRTTAGSGTVSVSIAGTGSGTVTSSPAGINCHLESPEGYPFTVEQQTWTGPCSAVFPVGSVVTFTGTADPGSHLDQGTINCGAERGNPCRRTVEAGTVSVEAYFCPDNNECFLGTPR